jgi:hypothetical protein
MNTATRILFAIIACLAVPAALRGQQLKPQTVNEFNCYVQSAESRMAARQAFQLAETDKTLQDQIVREKKIQTVPGNGPNPHKIAGALAYDWVGSMFIPGVGVDRLVQMLQDYDNRARYFPEVIAVSKLLCRRGDNRFGFTMRMKEPAVMDVESDVVWERVDPHRWRCRSYSTKVQEIGGKEHNYLLRLYSYWRFAEADKGVYVEAQAITLSGEFSSLMRTLGSMVGINPEKSLKKSLTEMRDSVSKPGIQFAKPPAGLPECGEPFRPGACEAKRGS